MNMMYDVAIFLFLLDVVLVGYLAWAAWKRKKAKPLMEKRKRALDQHKERLHLMYKTYLQAENRSPYGSSDPKLQFMAAHYQKYVAHINRHIDLYNEDVDRLNSLIPQLGFEKRKH